MVDINRPFTLFPALQVRPRLKRAYVKIYLLALQLQEANVDFVLDAVGAELPRPSEEDLSPENAQRRQALDEWVGSDYPFAYEESTGGFNLILRFLPDIRPIQGEETFISRRVNLSDVAERLANMGAKVSKGRKTPAVQAPAIPRSSFWFCLRNAMPSIRAEWTLIHRGEVDSDATPTFPQFLAWGLRLAFDQLHIYFLPWNARDASANQRDAYTFQGRPSKRSSHKYWVKFTDFSHEDTSFREYLRDTQRQGGRAPPALAARDDSRAPWSCLEDRVQDLYLFLGKVRLPDELLQILPQDNDANDDMQTSRGNASISSKAKGADDRVVDDTYRWATMEGTWDIQDPVHQLFLIMSVLFAKASPNLFYKVSQGDAPKEFSKLNAYIRGLEWTTSNSTAGGVTERTLLCKMMATTMLAFFEPSSPLSLHVAKTGALTRWSKKHSELPPSLSFSFSFSACG